MDLMVARPDVRLVHLQRVRGDLIEIHALGAQLEHAAADPRHLEQVIDEPHEMVDLPFHHLAHGRKFRGALARDPHDVQSVAQRCQRIAELV